MAAVPGYTDPQKQFTRSTVLVVFSSWLTLCWLGWFITEIVIHSLSQFADYAAVQPLSSMTIQLFMYAMLLTAATLMTAWFADFKRTQAARVTAFFVSTFCVFAWFWELWFIIPVFRDSNSSSNVWCSGFTDASGTFIDAADRFCHLSRATAGFSVATEFGLIMVNVWALVKIIVSRESNVPYPSPTLVGQTYTPVGQTYTPAGQTYTPTTVMYPADVNSLYLTDPEDIEQLRMLAAKPNMYDSYRRRMRGLSRVSLTLGVFSLIAWIMITSSYIKIAKDVGLDAYSSFLSNNNQLGDPVLSASWWPLTLTLGLSIGMTSYAAFRWNRSIQGIAFLVTMISALQWSSFFIYAARRLANDEDSGLLSVTSARIAQRAVVAGIGLLLITEVSRSIILLLRYRTYMPISQHDHQSLRASDIDTTVIDADQHSVAMSVPAPAPAAAAAATPTPAAGSEYQNRHGNGDWKPAYNLSALSGSSIIYQGLFALIVVTLFAWWFLEWVGQCSSGIFNFADSTITGRAPEATYVITENIFILTCLLALGSIVSSAYAEYHVSIAAATSSFYTNTLMLCGWFLLVWPWTYNSLPDTGALNSPDCTGRWCHISRGASIFAVLTVSWMGFIWFYSIGRIVARLHSFAKFDLSLHSLPTWMASIPICGIIIWAAANISEASKDSFLVNYQNLQPYAVGNEVPTSYWASIIFLLLTGLTFAMHIGTYSTLHMLCWEGRGWRNLVHNLNLLVLSFMIPILIITCRFINNNSLNSATSTMASGIILLISGQVFFYASIFGYLTYASVHASRAPAASTLRPGYQANVGQFAKAELAAMPTKDLEKGYGGGYVDPKEAAYNADVQHERTSDMGNSPVITNMNAPSAPALGDTRV